MIPSYEILFQSCFSHRFPHDFEPSTSNKHTKYDIKTEKNEAAYDEKPVS